jgi:dienelactone hydrolase
MNLKSLTCIPALCLAAAPLAGSEYSDLKRLEPVPATAQIPIVDFVRPAIFQSPKLNYTGALVGAIVSDAQDHTSLLTYDRTTQKVDGIGSRGDTDVSDFTWLDGRRLIYLISTSKYTVTGLFTGESGDLSNSLPLLRDVASEVIAIPPKDRMHPLMNLFADGINTGHYDDAVTVTASIAAQNFGPPLPPEEENVRHILARFPELKTDHGFNLGFLADKEGKLAFGITQQDGIKSLHKLVGEGWVKCPEDLDQIDVIEAGDNPGEVTVLGPRDGMAPRPLEFMDAETGKAGDVLLQDKSYDFDGWLFRDPVSYNIVGAVYDRAAPRVLWFTQSYRDLQALVDKLFPGMVVRILGLDDAGKTALISSTSDRQPPIYSWVDLEKHTSGLIKNSAPWIDPKRMQPMGVIKFKTAEGRQLDAYITLPAGASKKAPPPLVVLLHSDSGGRDTWGFNNDVQFLASRGYAVLQPNYRGSAGYTWMFPEQDSWEYRKIEDDVARATKAVIGMGIVDGSRVGIMGSSFGGYLAVSAAAFEPGVYKCALAISSLYDWGKYIQENKYQQFSGPEYSRLLYKLGDPGKNPQKFDAMSPLRHADQLRAALLIVWGEFDSPELISQSKSMATAADRNHVTVETMSFVNEAGGIHHLDHRLELYSHIEAFLAKNL